MFDLTRQERRVSLFLLTVALIGIGINFLIKRYSKIEVVAYLSQDMGKINLNKADKEMLMGICGIGEKIAQRIIEYRQRHIKFKYIEELKNIKGINNSKYQAIKEYFYLE